MLSTHTLGIQIFVGQINEWYKPNPGIWNTTPTEIHYLWKKNPTELSWKWWRDIIITARALIPPYLISSYTITHLSYSSNKSFNYDTGLWQGMPSRSKLEIQYCMSYKGWHNKETRERKCQDWACDKLQRKPALFSTDFGLSKVRCMPSRVLHQHSHVNKPRDWWGGFIRLPERNEPVINEWSILHKMNPGNIEFWQSSKNNFWNSQSKTTCSFLNISGKTNLQPWTEKDNPGNAISISSQYSKMKREKNLWGKDTLFIQ